MDSVLNGTKFKISVGDGYDSPAVKEINLSCIRSKTQLGSVFAPIDREKMGDNFYSGIDEPSNDCSDLAVTVFDQLGVVKRKWTTDPTHNGIGVWNRNLSYDDFLVIATVEIGAEHRRKGIGRAMIEAVRQQAADHGANRPLYGTW